MKKILGHFFRHWPWNCETGRMESRKRTTLVRDWEVSTKQANKCRGIGERDARVAVFEGNKRKKYYFRPCALLWHLKTASKTHTLVWNCVIFFFLFIIVTSFKYRVQDLGCLDSHSSKVTSYFLLLQLIFLSCKLGEIKTPCSLVPRIEWFDICEYLKKYLT